MIQLLVRDVRAVADFGVIPPRPPARRDRDMTVGFVFDPSGMPWHVAEVPF